MKVYKRTKKNSKNKILSFTLAFFAVLFSLFSYIHFIVDPVVVKAIRSQIDSVATTKISDAIYFTLQTAGFEYEDLVTVNYNSSGEIVSIVTNSINLNYLARKLSTYAQEYLDTMVDDGVDVAIGTFTGLSFFAGRGHKLNFKLVPIGSIITSFDSSFESKGINQTIHKMFVVVNVVIAVILPLKTQSIEFTTDMIVCENVIVGKVPEVYFSGKLF